MLCRGLLTLARGDYMAQLHFSSTLHWVLAGTTNDLAPSVQCVQRHRVTLGDGLSALMVRGRIVSLFRWVLSCCWGGGGEVAVAGAHNCQTRGPRDSTIVAICLIALNCGRAK